MGYSNLHGPSKSLMIRPKLAKTRDLVRDQTEPEYGKVWRRGRSGRERVHTSWQRPSGLILEIGERLLFYLIGGGYNSDGMKSP